MSTHTPGPWKIAPVDATGNGHAPTPHDMRLIAQAPALAALARRVAAHFADTDAPLGLAAAALLAEIDG